MNQAVQEAIISAVALLFLLKFLSLLASKIAVRIRSQHQGRSGGRVLAFWAEPAIAELLPCTFRR